jgi:DNA (cytosine-5)-methyltransferase 1
MNGLSLFSGAAIGEVVFKQKFPDYRTVGYVEIDRYCRSIIRARIRDGILDDAPIFDDIRTFNTRYARRYAGKVDFISGGFPCQPFSVAGKRQGADDERNMWPETVKSIGIIRPRFAFMENVPDILTHEYIRQIFGDLAEIGYDCEWDIIPAAFVGAPYMGWRLFMLAKPANSVNDGSIGTNKGKQSFAITSGNNGTILSKMWKSDSYSRWQSTTSGNWEQFNYGSSICRVAHGVAYRVDRLKALGNGWVPQVVDAILQVGE